MTWPAGNYTVSYEAVDMCDSTAVFNFEVIIAEEDAEYYNTGGLAQTIWLEEVSLGEFVNISEGNEGYADFSDSKCASIF